MSKEKQILQYWGDGRSQRQTAASLGVSRNTVSSVIAAAIREGIAPQAAASMDEPDLILKLFPEKAYQPVQVMPDFENIHKELLRDGVTLRLLWEEYVNAWSEAKQPPYMYSQFCKLYSDYVDKNRLTMHSTSSTSLPTNAWWTGPGQP